MSYNIASYNKLELLVKIILKKFLTNGRKYGKLYRVDKGGTKMSKETLEIRDYITLENKELRQYVISTIIAYGNRLAPYVIHSYFRDKRTPKNSYKFSFESVQLVVAGFNIEEGGF